jgi:hypothetical protein
LERDEGFARLVAERCARVPGVLAVTLGGSRAGDRPRPDSDWDFGLYYRRHLDTHEVRALGWPGQVFAPGEWGGGVMNGGAWLQVEGRRVDLHYRDLDDVEHWMAEAVEGRFRIERLLFYLAGVPTYMLVGELATAQVLFGQLPRPAFPAALREAASRRWREEARLTLDYARGNAARGDVIGCAGLLAQAVLQVAHARLAERGEWALNEKRMVEQAGLDHLAGLFARLHAEPSELGASVDGLESALLG